MRQIFAFSISQDFRRTESGISRLISNEKGSFDSESVFFGAIYPRNRSENKLENFEFLASKITVKMFPGSKVLKKNASSNPKFSVSDFPFEDLF